MRTAFCNAIEALSDVNLQPDLTSVDVICWCAYAGFEPVDRDPFNTLPSFKKSAGRQRPCARSPSARRYQTWMTLERKCPGVRLLNQTSLGGVPISAQLERVLLLGFTC